MISVIIAHRNDNHRLRQTIESIYRGWSGYDGLEITVVDDASETVPVIDSPSRYLKVKLIPSRVHLGVGACRQMGTEYTRGSILLFTDAHMLFPLDWDRLLLNALSPDMLLCSTYASDVPFQEWWYKGQFIGGADQMHFRTGTEKDVGKFVCAALKPRVPQHIGFGLYEVPAVIGAFYAIHRSLFERVSGFKGLEGYGGDEQLLSWKVWMSGAKVVCSADLMVKHLNSGPAVEHDWEKAFINLLYVERTVMGSNAFIKLANELPYHAMPVAIRADGRPQYPFPRVIEPDNISSRFNLQTIDQAIELARNTFGL